VFVRYAAMGVRSLSVDRSRCEHLAAGAVLRDDRAKCGIVSALWALRLSTPRHQRRASFRGGAMSRLDAHRRLRGERGWKTRLLLRNPTHWRA